MVTKRRVDRSVSPTTADPTIPTQEDFQFLISALAKPQRRVRFAPIVYAACSGPLAKEDVRDLWYSQPDLAGFKSQARKLASVMRKNNNTTTTKTIAPPCEQLRGLEHCSTERQRHRYMSIRCTLSAHRRGMTEDQTAMVARKCTAWSGEIAFVQACHDYANVYQPAMRSMIPNVTSCPPEFPFMMKQSMMNNNKRTVSSASASASAGCDRRVRRRTMVC